MKKIKVLVAIITVFTVNVQWLDLIQEQEPVAVAEAMQTLQREFNTVDGGFDSEIGGYDFLYQFEEVTIADVTEPTQTVANPSGSTDLYCPWNCGEEYWYPEGFKAIPEMCTEGNEMVDAIRADIASGSTGDWDGNGLWGADSVYSAGDQVAWDGLWVWKKYNITTGIGWTGWWVGLANYCEGNGYWSSSNKALIEFGDTATLTFTIAERTDGTGTYGVDLLAKTVEVLRMEGKYAAGGTIAAQTVTSPNFNSPFIYLDVPDGSYKVALKSGLDLYNDVSPGFTGNNEWKVNVEEGVSSVEGVPQEHLFYEFAMNKIDLNRNGVNFSSKSEMIEFLNESEFFSNLHMTAVEKQNSLGYLLTRLEEAENYYLTILSDDSVSDLVSISVEPAPEQLVRTFYAVYPTASPVSTEGGLIYPEKFSESKSTVKEYGEIIINPEIYVFWK